MLNFTALRILIAIVVIASIIIAISARPQLRVAVTKEVSVQVDSTATLTASLVRKGWGWGGFYYVGGTIKVNPATATHFSISPTTATTTATSPYANFTVSGLSVGTAYTQVTGTSAHGSHVGWFSSGPWVKIIVRQ